MGAGLVDDVKRWLGEEQYVSSALAGDGGTGSVPAAAAGGDGAVRMSLLQEPTLVAPRSGEAGPAPLPGQRPKSSKNQTTATIIAVAVPLGFCGAVCMVWAAVSWSKQHAAGSEVSSKADSDELGGDIPEDLLEVPTAAAAAAKLQKHHHSRRHHKRRAAQQKDAASPIRRLPSIREITEITPLSDDTDDDDDDYSSGSTATASSCSSGDLAVSSCGASCGDETAVAVAAAAVAVAEGTVATIEDRSPFSSMGGVESDSSCRGSSIGGASSSQQQQGDRVEDQAQPQVQIQLEQAPKGGGAGERVEAGRSLAHRHAERDDRERQYRRAQELVQMLLPFPPRQAQQQQGPEQQQAQQQHQQRVQQPRLPPSLHPQQQQQQQSIQSPRQLHHLARKPPLSPPPPQQQQRPVLQPPPPMHHYPSPMGQQQPSPVQQQQQQQVEQEVKQPASAAPRQTLPRINEQHNPSLELPETPLRGVDPPSRSFSPKNASDDDSAACAAANTTITTANAPPVSVSVCGITTTQLRRTPGALSSLSPVSCSRAAASLAAAPHEALSIPIDPLAFCSNVSEALLALTRPPSMEVAAICTASAAALALAAAAGSAATGGCGTPTHMPTLATALSATGAISNPSSPGRVSPFTSRYDRSVIAGPATATRGIETPRDELPRSILHEDKRSPVISITPDGSWIAHRRDRDRDRDRDREGSPAVRRA